jgi:hypothetical protein
MIICLETAIFFQYKAKIIYERVLLDAMRVCAPKENISSTFFKCGDKKKQVIWTAILWTNMRWHLLTANWNCGERCAVYRHVMQSERRVTRVAR